MRSAERTRWLVLPVLVGLVFQLFGCGFGSDEQFQGYIEGEYTYLAAPSAGYLQALHVQRGNRVKTGDVVFDIEAEIEQQGVNEAEARAKAAKENVKNLSLPRRSSEIATVRAQLEAAEAALELSEKQLKREQSLFEKKFISSARLDEAQTAYDRDKAQVEAARQQLKTYRTALGRKSEVRAAKADEEAASAQAAQKRWQLGKKTAVAPSDGEISETYYRPGEWVPAGAAVASLLPDSRRRIRFFVPQTVVAKLKPGQRIEATCDSCAEPIKATIDFIAPQAEYTPPVIYSRESREKLVFRVEAVPDAKQAAELRPGLPVDVQVVEQ